MKDSEGAAFPDASTSCSETRPSGLRTGAFVHRIYFMVSGYPGPARSRSLKPRLRLSAGILPITPSNGV